MQLLPVCFPEPPPPPKFDGAAAAPAVAQPPVVVSDPAASDGSEEPDSVEPRKRRKLRTTADTPAPAAVSFPMPAPLSVPVPSPMHAPLSVPVAAHVAVTPVAAEDPIDILEDDELQRLFAEQSSEDDDDSVVGFKRARGNPKKVGFAYPRRVSCLLCVFFSLVLLFTNFCFFMQDMVAEMFRLFKAANVASLLDGPNWDPFISGLYFLHGMVDMSDDCLNLRGLSTVLKMEKALQDECKERMAVCDAEYEKCLLETQRNTEEKLRCLQAAMEEAECYYVPLKHTYDQVSALVEAGRAEITEAKEVLEDMKMRRLCTKARSTQSLRCMHDIVARFGIKYLGQGNDVCNRMQPYGPGNILKYFFYYLTARVFYI